MFCTNCGAELGDDMAFCVQCGASSRRDEVESTETQQAAPVQQAAQSGQLQGSPVGQHASRKRIVLIAAIALCVVIVAAIALFVGCSAQKKTSEAQRLAHQKVAIALSIDAQGLDFATSTPVPMQVSGTTFDGSFTSEEFLYDGTSASVPELERGEYAVTVIASPISGNGTMYKLAIPSTTILVTDYEAEEQLRELGHDELIGSVQAEDSSTENAVMEGSALSLTPVAPIDVTDEMLAESCAALEKLGYDSSEISAHRQLVESSRNAARQEQLAKQTTFSDERLSLKVPASWGDHWSCDCRVMHSIQSGQFPNAWRYIFTNTANASEGFELVIQFAGSYGDFDAWTRAPSPGYYNNYIKNNGLPSSDFNAVVQSIVVKQN